MSNSILKIDMYNILTSCINGVLEGRRVVSPKSLEEHSQDVELSGLSGRSTVEIWAAVFALLAKPGLVLSRAPRDGICRLCLPLDAWRKVARGDEPCLFRQCLSST